MKMYSLSTIFIYGKNIPEFVIIIVNIKVLSLNSSKTALRM